MRTGEYVLGDSRGLQLLTILIILALLSVVAIPRYMDFRSDRQREVEEAAAHSYIRALNSVLTVNSANHELRGAAWVHDGEELMELLGEGGKMPPGMRYADNVWIDEKTGLQWEFEESSNEMPPRIRRVQQRPPPEVWEMEPIGQVPNTSPPKS